MCNVLLFLILMNAMGGREGQGSLSPHFESSTQTDLTTALLEQAAQRIRKSALSWETKRFLLTRLLCAGMSSASVDGVLGSDAKVVRVVLGFSNAPLFFSSTYKLYYWYDENGRLAGVRLLPTPKGGRKIGEPSDCSPAGRKCGK